MVILTLIKKDFKIAFKSPFGAIFKFLLIPLLAWFIFKNLRGEFDLNDPTEPEVVNVSTAIGIGIIGEYKYAKYAERAGAYVINHFDTRKDFDSFVENDSRGKIRFNLIEVVEKADGRAYNFLLQKGLHPKKGEQTNWFSTEVIGGLGIIDSIQDEAKEIGLLATKIEEIASSSRNRVSISFLEGGQSSTFKLGQIVEIIPNLIASFLVLVLLFLLPDYVKEREMKTLNLLYRQGITPFQIFAAKFAYGFLFFLPGIGMLAYFLAGLGLSSIPSSLLVGSVISMFVLTILTAYFISLFFVSTKSSTSFSVVIFFGSIAATYAFKTGILWWGFAYLIQFLPLVNNNTIINLLFAMAVIK